MSASFTQNTLCIKNIVCIKKDAVVGMHSVKKMFLKILQISQKNNCVEISIYK